MMEDSEHLTSPSEEGAIIASSTPNAADAAIQDLNSIIPLEKPATVTEERDVIKKFEDDSTLHLQKTYYVIPSKWWKQWKEFVGYERYGYSSDNSRVPPPIDNSVLIEANDPPGEERIKKTLMENYDFHIVSEETWVNLQKWYVHIHY